LSVKQEPCDELIQRLPRVQLRPRQEHVGTVPPILTARGTGAAGGGGMLSVCHRWARRSHVHGYDGTLTIPDQQLAHHGSHARTPGRAVRRRDDGGQPACPGRGRRRPILRDRGIALAGQSHRLEPAILSTRWSRHDHLGASLGANLPPLVPLYLQFGPQDATFSQVAKGAAACSRFRFQPVGVRLPSAPPALTSVNGCTNAA